MRLLTPKESLRNTLVHNARDWSIDKADAWLWGIIVGWDAGSLKQLQKQHGWNQETVRRLQQLHKKFTCLK